MRQTLQFWFRRKYNLAPTDQRFLEATISQMEADYWAHHYFENPNVVEDVDDDFDMDSILAALEAEAAAKEAEQVEAAAIEEALAKPDDWEEVT
jgi:hypothetical protein